MLPHYILRLMISLWLHSETPRWRNEGLLGRLTDLWLLVRPCATVTEVSSTCYDRIECHIVRICNSGHPVRVCGFTCPCVDKSDVPGSQLYLVEAPVSLIVELYLVGWPVHGCTDVHCKKWRKQFV